MTYSARCVKSYSWLNDEFSWAQESTCEYVDWGVLVGEKSYIVYDTNFGFWKKQKYSINQGGVSFCPRLPQKFWEIFWL